MASEVDICNIALGHLGESANVSSISPPEGSVWAEHCQRFYPIARDTALEMHDWAFATRRVQLAPLAAPPSTNWRFAYAVPPRYVKPINILMPGQDDTERNDFTIETADNGSLILYTNVEQAILRYITRVSDTTKFSPLFVDTVGWLLASYLAGPVIKGEGGMNAGAACYKTAEAQLGRASKSDANGQQLTVRQTPDWLKGRTLDGGSTWGRR